ncbi:hypothetical protein CCACVL1_16503 [Corchorus capsularis]|uniref:Uncharacterized protein n=1 Tax=Corchorus capsularis TaxID=210143 RepID=A0A1R3HWJ1_COCAP|nr:hypothetical protein CCACVL1_16503 [Corchorus capsularis]
MAIGEWRVSGYLHGLGLVDMSGSL